MRLLPAPVPETFARGAEDVEETPGADADAVAAIAEKLEFRYGHSDAAELPSKLTVTELKGRLSELEASEDAETLLPRAPAPFARPSFVIEKSALSATERGTALHLVMQYIDYAACADEASVRAAIGGLVEKQLITPAQGDAADASKIAAFFASELGKRVRNAAVKYREFKFSLLTPARELLPNDCGDEILFQGVADCVLVEDGKLTIVDFKTDRVTEETLQDKVAAYTPQLDAYSRALTRVLGLPVAQRALYFFGLNRAVFV
jgi:ATP-dependent helicase/nuclease subunit A